MLTSVSIEIKEENTLFMWSFPDDITKKESLNSDGQQSQQYQQNEQPPQTSFTHRIQQKKEPCNKTFEIKVLVLDNIANHSVIL